MKRFFSIACILLTTLLIGCTHDKTPAGVYTGHYDNANLPVAKGKGTITIRDTLFGKVNVLFMSDGNPDVKINNLNFSTESLNNNFTIKSEDFSGGGLLGSSITGFCGTRKNGYLQITNSDPAFHFNGRKSRK